MRIVKHLVFYNINNLPIGCINNYYCTWLFLAFYFFKLRIKPYFANTGNWRQGTRNLFLRRWPICPCMYFIFRNVLANTNNAAHVWMNMANINVNSFFLEGITPILIKMT